MEAMRIGVDVGGTNTDAVLMCGSEVKVSHKAPTSENVSDGIVTAVESVLKASSIRPEQVQSVMVGTTQFTNAFVERRFLLPVGIIRLALPATRSLPPMIDWPDDIARAIGQHHYLVGGGYEFDGRPIAPLDKSAIASAAKDLGRKGIRSVAITSVFSPLNDNMEKLAEEIVRCEIPDVSVSLSSRIGRIGLLERENATIMNASLSDLSISLIASFRDALARLDISAPFYISQNDGTLMTADFAEKYPVLTFASGPTNSMRGAAYLSGIKNALVADIGGTTTDVGMLVNGFPRESTVTVDIGGVRTNFRMPDILALGLGGGSLVKLNSNIKIGPESVGFRIKDAARTFGGDILTATDIAVAAGHADIGDRSRLSDLSPTFIDESLGVIHQMLENLVDRMKTSSNEVPLILVGGGSILVNRDIAGVSEIIVPDHAGVANAIGASITQVGGEIDKVYSYEEVGRETAIDCAKKEAIKNAIEAGANESSVEVIDFEEIYLAYMPGNAVRLRVKAAGELRA